MYNNAYKTLKRFFSDVQGATALEYALLGALIFLTIIGGVTLMSESNMGLYSKTGKIQEAMQNANTK